MSPWGVCASRRSPGEGHKRGDSRLSERFGKSLSLGPENTLAWGGGQQAWVFSSGVLSCLCSLQRWTLHPVPPTPPPPTLPCWAHTTFHQTPESSLSFQGCFLVLPASLFIKWEDDTLSFPLHPLFFFLPWWSRTRALESG